MTTVKQTEQKDNKDIRNVKKLCGILGTGYKLWTAERKNAVAKHCEHETHSSFKTL